MFSRKWHWLKVLIPIGLIILALTGCFNTNSSGYQTFVMSEGAAQFSFEYSSKYKIGDYKPLIDTLKFRELASVSLIAPFNKQSKDFTSILFLVWAVDILAPNAESQMEMVIKKASTSMDFKLLEQTGVTVSNVPAKLIAYTERNIQPIDRGLKEPPFEVWREVFFDYNGLIWEIEMRSDSSTAEEDKADFEHILQTFKILN